MTALEKIQAERDAAQEKLDQGHERLTDSMTEDEHRAASIAMGNACTERDVLDRVISYLEAADADN